MSGRVTRTKSGAVKRNCYAEDDISDSDVVDVQSNGKSDLSFTPAEQTDDDDNYQSDDNSLKKQQSTMANQTKRKKKATSGIVNEQAAPVEEPSAEAIRLGEYLKRITVEAKAEDITYACGLCNVGFEEGEEVGLSLPCGHVFGHNCLAGRSTCPVARCKTTLYYPNCRHPIPLTAFRLGLFTQRENEKPFKCVDCTIKDIEHGVNLQGLEFRE
ncbi:hypothetical protein B0O99DRAFT_668684 [Bisporella sp. PMI_857]|nr:hypothetical protein B0O99DRAFT_668684 [Bisporella sp. PMI_857]